MPGIDAFEVITYSSRVGMAAQQLEAKLGVTTQKEPIAGKQRRWKAYGAMEMAEVFGRAATTNWQEMTRLQRTIMRQRWGLPVLLDTDSDEIDLQQYFEPNAQFMKTLMAAGARAYDRSILASYDGVAFAGDEGTTSTVFDTGQDIAVGIGGVNQFNLTKVMQAKEKLDLAEWPEEGRYMVVHPTMLRQLLLDVSVGGTGSSPIVGSFDFNEVKALVRGAINYFAGFTWILTSLIPTHTSGLNRYAYAVHNMAFASGVQDTAEIKIGEIPERNWAKGIGAYLFTASTRLFENGVVRINSTIA